MFTAAVILLVIVTALSLYYYVFQLGVQPWSVKGSILSLLPSFLITPMLWVIKKYFFKKDRATDVEEGFSMTVHHQSTSHQENTEEEEEEEEAYGEERKLVAVV